MVVEVEPSGKSSGALAFGSPRLRVGPLDEQRAVEAFNFAVRRWPVGPGERVLDVAERGVEEPAAVAGAVVGEHSFDRDAVLCEEAGGALPERCCSGALFIAEDLAVGQAGVAVDRGMHEGVTDFGAM